MMRIYVVQQPTTPKRTWNEVTFTKNANTERAAWSSLMRSVSVGLTKAVHRTAGRSGKVNQQGVPLVVGSNLRPAHLSSPTPNTVAERNDWFHWDGIVSAIARAAEERLLRNSSWVICWNSVCAANVTESTCGPICMASTAGTEPAICDCPVSKSSTAYDPSNKQSA
jgi:hypothetical protein